MNCISTKIRLYTAVQRRKSIESKKVLTNCPRWNPQSLPYAATRWLSCLPLIIGRPRTLRTTWIRFQWERRRSRSRCYCLWHLISRLQYLSNPHIWYNTNNQKTLTDTGPRRISGRMSKPIHPSRSTHDRTQVLVVSLVDGRVPVWKACYWELSCGALFYCSQ